MKIKYDIKTDVNGEYWIIFIWMENEEVVEICFDNDDDACDFAEALGKATSFVYISRSRETELLGWVGTKALERL